MDEKRTKLYMELQMQELKESLNQEEKKSAPINNQNQNAEIAQLYEDAYAFEEQLAFIEKELDVIKKNDLQNLLQAFATELPHSIKDYSLELKKIVEQTWEGYANNNHLNAKEQLQIIKESEFSSIAQKLTEAFKDYNGDFEVTIKDIFIKRWEAQIEVLKKYLKDEFYEMKIRGLKPHYVKRIYEEFHGLIEKN